MGPEQNIFTKITDGAELKQDNSTSFFENMSLQIQDICNDLSADKEKFQEEIVYRKILEYVASDRRILYSQITSEIFSYYDKDEISNPDERIENMTGNLIKLVEFSRNPECKGKIKTDYPDEKYQLAVESMTKVCIKMWDHINLASRQYSDLKQTDDEFKDKFNQRFDQSFDKSFKESVGPETEKLQESMNSQLITLVGIFTALAFLVFGGITSLDNVFESTEIPVLKLMAIGSVWGLCILNMIFVFLYCVQRLTRVNISQSDDKKTVLERYPIVFWSDFCIVTVMVVTLWIYYLKNRAGLAWIDNLLVRNPLFVVLIGSTLLIVLIVAVAKRLVTLTGMKTKSKGN